jgi:hypothetical protein
MTYAKSARVELEGAEDGGVREAQLHGADQQRHRQHQPRRLDVTAAEQATGCGDGAEVGTNVDGVGCEHGHDAHSDEPGREFAAQRSAEPDPCVQGDARTRLLHSDHQGEGEQRQPQRPETELAAGLRVGADPRRVVVGGPGDQPRAEELEHPLRAHRDSLFEAGAARRRTAGRRCAAGVRRRLGIGSCPDGLGFGSNAAANRIRALVVGLSRSFWGGGHSRVDDIGNVITCERSRGGSGVSGRDGRAPSPPPPPQPPRGTVRGRAR